MESRGRRKLDELVLDRMKLLSAKLLILATVLALFPFPVLSQSNKVRNKDVKQLVKSMAGEFSSEDQAKADPAFFHIKLRMRPIWKKKKDGHWLYVEQAAAESEDKPYRQRIYNVYKTDTAIVSKVYEIKDPAKYVGGWKDGSLLDALALTSLIDRQGCAIFLTKNAEGVFVGSTPGKECLSTLRGAAYATSEVQIFADRIDSWDRGWDKDDKQVWGAVKGGYVFKKLLNY